jgi:hypothetical protein
VEETAGWGEEDLIKPYAQTVKYQRVTTRDLAGDTWVDIIGPEGKPLRRNVGRLRWAFRGRNRISITVPLPRDQYGVLINR